jgi:hypothetical protein
MRVYAALFVIFAFATAHAQSACQKVDPSRHDVPACPASGLLPDNLYPAMALTISDSEGGPEFVRSVVQKVIAANPSAPPQFLIGASPETIEAVRKDIQSSSIDPKIKALYLSAITRTPDNDYNWQQDFMQPYVDTKTGRPVLREVSQYKNVRSEVIKSFKNIVSEGASCGIRAGPPLSSKETIVNGMFGGNIEGGPGGLCLLGDDHFADGQWDEYAKSACANSKAIVKVPTKFLSVGHVDEVVTTVRVPGKKAPCDFAILVASPREGLKALRKNPKAQAVSYAGADQKTNYERTLYQAERLAPSPFEDVCQAYFNQRENRSIESKARSRSVSWVDRLIPRALAETKPGAGGAQDGCDQVPSGDLAEAIQKDPELGPYNESIQKDLDRFKQDYAAALKAANPTCGEPTLIDVPDLFHGKTVEKDGKIVAAEGDSWNGLSVYANPTNDVQIGKTVLLPDPGNENFRHALNEKLEALGLKTDYVDTFFAHAKQGNLHCSTNVIRYCRPLRGAN